MNRRRKKGQFVPTGIKSKLLSGSKSGSSDKNEKEFKANSASSSLYVESKVEDNSLSSETVHNEQLKQKHQMIDSENGDLHPSATTIDSSLNQGTEKVHGTDKNVSTTRDLAATPSIPVAKSNTNLINSSVPPNVNLNSQGTCDMEVSTSLDQAEPEKAAEIECSGTEFATLVTVTNPCLYSISSLETSTCDSSQLQDRKPVTTSDNLVKCNSGIEKGGKSATSEINKDPPTKKRRTRARHVPKLKSSLTKSITSKTNQSATTESKSQDDRKSDVDSSSNNKLNSNSSDDDYLPSSIKDYSKSKGNKRKKAKEVEVSAETSTEPECSSIYKMEQDITIIKLKRKLNTCNDGTANQKDKPVLDLVNPTFIHSKKSKKRVDSSSDNDSSNDSDSSDPETPRKPWIGTPKSDMPPRITSLETVSQSRIASPETVSLPQIASPETVGRPRIASPVPLINTTKSKSMKKKKRKYCNKREAQQHAFKMSDGMRKDGEWNVDTDKLTFSHIIHINPPADCGRQMGIRLRERDRLEKLKNISVTPNNTVQSSAPQPTTGSAPQVRLNEDGQIVIDTTSLQAPQSQSNDLVVVFHEERINQNSFRSKPMKKRSNWSKAQTETFYEAIRRVGIDFNTMKMLFVTRKQDELQRKYKMENKKCPHKISEAVKIHARNTVWTSETFKPLDVDQDEVIVHDPSDDDTHRIREPTELVLREPKAEESPLALMPNITTSEQVLPGIQNIFGHQ